MTESNLNESDENEVFERYPLFQQMGKDDFEIKLWILLKGIESGDGEPVKQNSLAYKPCTAMLKQNITAEHILFILNKLHQNKIIEIPDPNSIESMRTFVVKFKPAYDLNKILSELDLGKFLDDDSKSKEILHSLGFDVNEIGDRNSLLYLGKKVWFYLNNSNGLATAKFVKEIIFSQLVEKLPDVSEHLHD